MRRRAAVSQVNRYWICHEVQSDLPRNLLCLKVAPDCISYLVLEFSQIFTLRCDPALTKQEHPKRRREDPTPRTARLGRLFRPRLHGTVSGDPESNLMNHDRATP